VHDGCSSLQQHRHPEQEESNQSQRCCLYYKLLYYSLAVVSALISQIITSFMQTLHRVLVNGIFVAGYPPQSSTPVMARQMRVHIALQAAPKDASKDKKRATSPTHGPREHATTGCWVGNFWTALTISQYILYALMRRCGALPNSRSLRCEVASGQSSWRGPEQRLRGSTPGGLQF
jgi:hypothetical protein